MGVTFFILCYGCKPTVCKIKNENYYSKDIKLLEIISLKHI